MPRGSGRRCNGRVVRNPVPPILQAAGPKMECQRSLGSYARGGQEAGSANIPDPPPLQPCMALPQAALVSRETEIFSTRLSRGPWFCQRGEAPRRLDLGVQRAQVAAALETPRAWP